MPNDPHRGQAVLSAGVPLADAKAAVVLIHGRGASAEDILGLSGELADPAQPIAFLAPQAAGNVWYPESFLAPIAANEPWLTSAIAAIAATVKLALDGGIARERIVLCGFSQGACLASEFVARNPARYGAMIAFTGGLVGPPDHDLHHDGSLEGTPALFTSGDPDPHVPWARVVASAEQYTAMGASVQLFRFPGKPHSVSRAEIDSARKLVAALLP